MNAVIATSRWAAALLATTIFVSAFLLFQVQPLLARYILPWFGGMPEVWTTCMLFFQMFLLGGYAYAHAISRLTLRRQVGLHAALVLAAAATLSIIPDAMLKPAPDDEPVLKILYICAVCVGLAYFVLSATSPLVQSWFSRTLPGRDPYRLYALSNVGSLLALGSFPFVFEPLLSRDATAHLWSAGFYGYAGLIVLCAVLLFERGGDTSNDSRREPKDSPPAAADSSHSTPRQWLFWLALPMTASVALLAVTNMVTLDIAVIPFLWVLPLMLYLLSFILCFDHPRWYRRGVYLVVLIGGVVGHIWVGQRGTMMHGGMIIAIYAVMLFGACMICHGELYRRRPHSRHLTRFYLMVSVGGAMGGVFVAVIAPLIFNYYHELWLSMLATVLLVLMGMESPSPGFARRRRWWAALICMIGLSAIFLKGQAAYPDWHQLDSSRNFFGILTVMEKWPDKPDVRIRTMQHGTTYHGLQLWAEDKRHWPTSYYGSDSGVGLILRHGPKDLPRRIGVVGLGVGTIAVYGQEGDLMRFYEINPEVVRMAYGYFSYLDDSAAEIEIVLGDARLSMEYEAPQQYDVLALDAFSSDAIPVHLLTRQAFEIYLSHLADGGVLAVHISTRHLDLQSVVWKLAEDLSLHHRWIQDPGDDDSGTFYSNWILLAEGLEVLNLPVIRNRQSIPYADLSRVPLWTDDHINLLKVFRSPVR